MTLSSSLARLHGTEQDSVNCAFYLKCGACRHGDTCDRNHQKPPFSTTLLIKHMWLNPYYIASVKPDTKIVQESFDEFYEEVFQELSKSGEVVEMVVCENTSEHITGNVYVQFDDEDIASDCMQSINQRFFAGRRLNVEYSPVRDFREALCKDFDESMCSRAGNCNFLHCIVPSAKLMTYLREKYGFLGHGGSMASAMASGGGGRDRDRDRRRDDRRSNRSWDDDRNYRNRDRGDDRNNGRDYKRRDDRDRDKGGDRVRRDVRDFNRRDRY